MDENVLMNSAEACNWNAGGGRGDLLALDATCWASASPSPPPHLHTPVRTVLLSPVNIHGNTLGFEILVSSFFLFG